MSENIIKLALVNSDTDAVNSAATDLKKLYDFVPIEEADVIVALGGDGFMLHLLHKLLEVEAPIFGMNLGTVGFLLNKFNQENLIKRIREAIPFIMYPLKMDTVSVTGELTSALAFN